MQYQQLAQRNQLEAIAPELEAASALEAVATEIADAQGPNKEKEEEFSVILCEPSSYGSPSPMPPIGRLMPLGLVTKDRSRALLRQPSKDWFGISPLKADQATSRHPKHRPEPLSTTLRANEDSTLSAEDSSPLHPGAMNVQIQSRGGLNSLESQNRANGQASMQQRGMISGP